MSGAEPMHHPQQGPELVAWVGRLASALTDARDLGALSRALTAQVRRVVDAEYISFYMLDPGSDRLRMFAQHGFTREEQEEAERTAHERHPGWVVRTGQPLHVPDVEADPEHRTRDRRRRHHIRSRLFLPLESEGQCVGTLGMASVEPDHFAPLHVAALTFLCRLAGVVHHNLWRVEALERQLAQIRQQQEDLNQLSAPIVEVLPGALVLPVIGHVDDARAADLTERLLHATAAHRARVVLLDLTGLAVDDGSSLALLARVPRALRLLGARCLVSGLSPRLALAAVEHGVDLSPEHTFGSLAQALALVWSLPTARKGNAG